MSAVIQMTWVFSTLPLLLNWLNQHRIALLTKVSPPHAQRKSHSTVTLDLLLANEMTPCFLLHACHCINCGSGSAYNSWKCMCMYMRMCKKCTASFRKFSEFMNMLQPTPPLYFSSLESDNSSKLCTSIILQANKCGTT